MMNRSLHFIQWTKCVKQPPENQPNNVAHRDQFAALFVIFKIVGQFTMCMCVLSVAIVSVKSTAADDRVRARELLREAFHLCDADCPLSANLVAVYLELATGLAAVGDLETSKKAFARTWSVATKVEYKDLGGMVLIQIAEDQVRSGQAKDAIATTECLATPGLRTIVLSSIAIALADVGETEAALQIIDRMPAKEADDLRDYDMNISMIVKNLAMRGDYKDARCVLERIPADFERAATIKAKNVSLGKLDPQQRRVVERASMNGNALLVIAEEQAKSGRLRDALRSAIAIPFRDVRDVALRRVACVAAGVGDVVVAQECCDEIYDQEEKDLALVCYVGALSKKGRFKDAAYLTGQIDTTSEKAKALLEIAIGYAASGDACMLETYFEKATLLGSLEQVVRNSAEERIVAAYLESANITAAEKFTSHLLDPYTLSRAYQTIAVAKGKRRDRDGAKRMFEKSKWATGDIVETYARCTRLQELAIAQAGAGDFANAKRTMKSAIATAKKLDASRGINALALTESAISQVSMGDRDSATHTFNLAATAVGRDRVDETFRARLLQKLVEAQTRVGYVSQALKAVRKQKSPVIRAQMLLGVANGLIARAQSDSKKG